MAQDTTYMFVRPMFVPKGLTANQVSERKLKEVTASNYAYVNDSAKYTGYARLKYNEYGQLTHLAWQIDGRGDRRIYVYNDNHLLIEDKWYNEVSNELYTTTRYTYNENNLLRYVHGYDNNGKVRDSTVYNFVKDTLYPVEILNYNLHSWMEDSVRKNSVKLSSRSVCQYDKNNNLTGLHKYDELGRHDISQKWVYNKNNHVVKEGTGRTGTETQRIYDVDTLGHILRSTWKMKGAREVFKENIYDNGKVVYHYACVGGLLNTEEEFAYDNIGNLVLHKAKVTDFPNEEIVISYEYDEYGNFTKMVVTVNNMKTTMQERVLVYY